jgi:hypothetical protein
MFRTHLFMRGALVQHSRGIAHVRRFGTSKRPSETVDGLPTATIVTRLLDRPPAKSHGGGSMWHRHARRPGTGRNAGWRWRPCKREKKARAWCLGRRRVFSVAGAGGWGVSNLARRRARAHQTLAAATAPGTIQETGGRHLSPLGGVICFGIRRHTVYKSTTFPRARHHMTSGAPSMRLPRGSRQTTTSPNMALGLKQRSRVGYMWSGLSWAGDGRHDSVWAPKCWLCRLMPS